MLWSCSVFLMTSLVVFFAHSLDGSLNYLRVWDWFEVCLYCFLFHLSFLVHYLGFPFFGFGVEEKKFQETFDERNAIRELKNNEKIIMKPSNKRGDWIVLDSCYYEHDYILIQTHKNELMTMQTKRFSENLKN